MPERARNAGIAAAKGPLLAFLDSDDEWHADKIVLQRTFLERHPDVLFAFTNFGVRLEDGTEEHNSLRWWLRKPEPLDRVFAGGSPTPRSHRCRRSPDFLIYVASFYLKEMYNNIIPAFTLMVRKAEAEGALGFATDLPTCEEWPAFGQLTRRGRGALLDTETAWQHSHSGVRLTQLPAHVWASAWLSTLERIWGRDPAFLAEHERAYREVTQEAHLMRGVSLIRHGSPLEGAREMRHAGPGAWRSFWYGTASKHAMWVMYAAWGWVQGLWVWFQS